jgi:hypothetical protein
MPLVEMTEEQIARKWLYSNCLGAIDWNVIEALVKVYREHGPKVPVFDAAKMTYILRDPKPVDEGMKLKAVHDLIGSWPEKTAP